MSGSTAQTIIIIFTILSKKRKELHIIPSKPSPGYSTTAPVNYEISEFLPLASLSCRIISNHHKARGRKYSILLCCQLFISVSAHTNGVLTLSQLAESVLITTWQTRPPLRTKGRCHFINLLWPHQRVNSPSKKEKKEKKLVTIAATSLESQFVFSPAIFYSLPLRTVSTFGEDGWCVSWRRSEVQIREGKEGGLETQSVMMIPLVIYNQMSLRPAGHYLIIHLEGIVKFSLLQDFICLHIVVLPPPLHH